MLREWRMMKHIHAMRRAYCRSTSEAVETVVPTEPSVRCAMLLRLTPDVPSAHSVLMLTCG